MDRLWVVADERSNGERPGRVDGAEQEPLNLVVERLAEPRRIEVLFDETTLRGTQLEVPPGHCSTVGKLSLRRVEVETVESASRAADEPFLVPLGDIVVLTGELRHGCSWDVWRTDVPL